MEIVRGIPQSKTTRPHPILAVGNFDGVHLGHQAILKTVVGRARELGGTALAMTFDPHPVRVLYPDRALSLLTSSEQKARLIANLGFDQLLQVPFTLAFSQQKPSEFVENILCHALGAEEIYVGKNFAFGRGREGKVEDLTAIGQALGIKVFVVEQVKMKERVISSSLIRKLLSAGEISQVSHFLGRAYEIEGIVVPGQQRGRKLGYPTANLHPLEQMVPLPGVYAVLVFKGEQDDQKVPLPAIGYVGTRPTFGQGDAAVEIHLLNYQGELYQEHMRVVFLERVREERVFSGGKELAQQIEKDIEKALMIHAQAIK